jgi:tRNA threonylcarbamoyl adenosine modification protein (Sua5/YciO/YrdC/YwlC family)
MAAELIRIHPKNPEMHKVRQVVQCLANGGVIIYPTDTVYGIGCSLYSPRAIEKICRLKGVKPDKMHLSFICYDLSELSHYAKHVSNPAFRMMKKALPGPFTFILESSGKVPKIFDVKKKQVGIRVPDHHVPRLIVQALGNPLLTTSVKDDDEMIEYMTDPELIWEKYQHTVDMVIDSGYGGIVPSTVVSCLDDSFEVIREGAGDIAQYL